MIVEDVVARKNLKHNHVRAEFPYAIAQQEKLLARSVARNSEVQDFHLAFSKAVAPVQFLFSERSIRLVHINLARLGPGIAQYRYPVDARGLVQRALAVAKPVAVDLTPGDAFVSFPGARAGSQRPSEQGIGGICRSAKFIPE